MGSMLKAWRRWLVVVFLASAASAQAAPLRFLTHELPPMNFATSGGISGFSVELVRELMKRTGIDGPIEMMPFVRAYRTALDSPNTVVFFTSRTAEREQLFAWVGPIANVRNEFFVRRGSNIKIEQMADLRRAKAILVHRGSNNEQSLRRLGFNNLELVNRPEDAVRLMANTAHADSLGFITSMVVPETLKKYGLAPDLIKPVFLAHQLQAYLAFSLKTPANVVERFQDALDKMKRDGSFDTLYHKWLPLDTPPGITPEAAIDRLAH